MEWGFEDIPRLVAQFEADWLAKHPDFKPSHDGTKLAIDDQYERNNYGQVDPCKVWVESGVGKKVQVPSATFRPFSLNYQEDQALRELYDERKL